MDRRLPLAALFLAAALAACSDDAPLGPAPTVRDGAPPQLAAAPDNDADGIPNTVEPGEGTNPNVKDNDVFTRARLFAMQQYRDFLGREGDAGGITSWTNAIQGGASRASVIDAFSRSSEFQTATAPVVRLYFAYFQRVPDTAGLLFWLDRFRAGASLDEISDAFAQSDEFAGTYGSVGDSTFVELVYQNVLGRPADPAGRDFWVDRLGDGLPRGAVMTSFSESDEYRDRSFADIYVTLMYVGMLRRSPDPSGFAFWRSAVGGGGSGLPLIQGFLDSPEYRDRFLPRGFSGSVRDLFAGAVAGLQVQVGSATATTNASGDFVTSLAPSGIQPITVSGSGFVTRTTYASTNANLPNALTVVPTSFDMASYNEVVRRNSNATIRWTTTPSIYVDTRGDSVAGGVPQSYVNAAVAAAQAFPDQWTGGQMNPSVTVGTAPPADFTTNTIVIRFTDAVNPSGCGGTVGVAHFSWNGSRELRGSVVRLALGRLCSSSGTVMQAVVGHELGHSFGLSHSTLSGRASLMEPVIRLTALSTLDQRNAALHYRRTPGHASPDVESNLFAQRGIAPQAVGPDRRETYVCPAGI